MRLGAAAFALGVWLLAQVAALPGLIALGGLFAAGAALTAAGATLGAGTRRLRRMSRARSLRLPLLACGVGLLGFVWAGAWAHWRLADRLDPAWEGRDIELTGVVAALPQPFDGGVRFEFAVESVRPAEARVPRRVLLSWYDGMSREEHQEVVPVRAGERWRLPVRLRLPHGQVNPHGFDYEAWLLERAIRATGSVRARAARERLDAFVAGPGTLIERLRGNVRDRFWDALAEQRFSGVLTALAIGDQRAIEPAHWQVFTRTGVNHLMSISGLHVTMVSGLFAGLVLVLWRRSQALALRLPAQKAAALAGFAAAFAYALIAGFAVPAQRTLYMVGVVALALLLDRSSSPSRVLALALLAVLLLDPWAVLSPGFWLSFGAVALIFYVGAGRVGKHHWLAQWGAMQWAVTVGLAPPLLVLFQQVSLVSPIANAIAIPLVSLVVTPLALAGAALPFDFPLHLAHRLLEWLMLALGWLAALDAGLWRQSAPQVWTVCLALLGVAWLLLPRGFPARWVGALLLLPIASVAPAPLPHGAVSLTVFEVGHGLAVLVRTRAHALLYDAGPTWSAEADSGNRVIVPALRGKGVRALDALVVSHDDTDHVGGALSVLREVPAARLYSSLPAFHPVAQASAYRIACADGAAWEWDGVRFEFLHPPMRRYADPGASANSLSCVLRVSGADGAMLITGDIDWRAERDLLERRAGDLGARVLVVPHHGGNSSSSPAFLRAVAPEVAVFPTGYRNRFGHPRAEVLERYQSIGARVLRTDESGAIEVVLAGGAMSASGQRQSAPRYWHGR